MNINKTPHVNPFMKKRELEPVKQMIMPTMSPTITERKSSYIRTYTGRKFYPLEPWTTEVDILDIAHALSNICRFTGHVREYYSVAQHSVHVSFICGSSNALWGLLHDASEAYICDISRPVKHSPEMEAYRTIEKNLMYVICDAYNLPREMPSAVKNADDAMLSTEIINFMQTTDIGSLPTPLNITLESWNPQKAEHEFLKRYIELTQFSKK